MNTISPEITNRVNDKRAIKQSNYKKTQSFKATNPVSIITKDQQKIFNIFSKYYGGISSRIGNKLGKLASEKGILARNSRFTIEQGVSSIKPKAFHKSLLENVTFPVTSLPLYSANWVLQKAKNVPTLKNGAERLYNKPFFRIPRKLNEMDAKTDIIKGMYDKTDDIIKKFCPNKIKKSTLYEYRNNDTNQPKCPTCQSTNIKKISATSKAVSVGLFGLFSQKVKKQFCCGNCGYEW